MRKGTRDRIVLIIGVCLVGLIIIGIVTNPQPTRHDFYNCYIANGPAYELPSGKLVGLITTFRLEIGHDTSVKFKSNITVEFSWIHNQTYSNYGVQTINPYKNLTFHEGQDANFYELNFTTVPTHNVTFYSSVFLNFTWLDTRYLNTITVQGQTQHDTPRSGNYTMGHTIMCSVELSFPQSEGESRPILNGNNSNMVILIDSGIFHVKRVEIQTDSITSSENA
jgi:hypothetical protein